MIDLTLVLWYVKGQTLRAEARTDQRQMPEALFKEATETRNRMLKLADYHLRTSPQNIAEIEEIRSGPSHVDLVTNLDMLARFVAAHEDLVRDDRVNYRPNDVAHALTLVEQMYEAMAKNREIDWKKWAAKSFILFRDTYGWVRQGALFVTYDMADAPSFPTLFSAARKRRSNTSASDKPETKKTEKQKNKSEKLKAKKNETKPADTAPPKSKAQSPSAPTKPKDKKKKFRHQKNATQVPLPVKTGEDTASKDARPTT